MTFQLPATIAVKRLGPRVVFPAVTVFWGLVTLVSGWVFLVLGEWLRFWPKNLGKGFAKSSLQATHIEN